MFKFRRKANDFVRDESGSVIMFVLVAAVVIFAVMRIVTQNDLSQDKTLNGASIQKTGFVAASVNRQCVAAVNADRKNDSEILIALRNVVTRLSGVQSC